MNVCHQKNRGFYASITILCLAFALLMCNVQNAYAITDESSEDIWIGDFNPTRDILDSRLPSLIARQPDNSMEQQSLATFTDELEDALNSTDDQTDVLPLARDNFLYSEWWGDWEIKEDTQLTNDLDAMYLTGPLSTELIPDAPLWFLDGLNPYHDVLPAGETVSAVLLTHGWNADGDGQALLFITEADDGSYEWSGMIFAQTGFIR